MSFTSSHLFKENCENSNGARGLLVKFCLLLLLPCGTKYVKWGRKCGTARGRYPDAPEDVAKCVDLSSLEHFAPRERGGRLFELPHLIEDEPGLVQPALLSVTHVAAAPWDHMLHSCVEACLSLPHPLSHLPFALTLHPWVAYGRGGEGSASAMLTIVLVQGVGG